MVLDDADALIEALATALRDRRAGMSITDAFVGALEAYMHGFDLLDDDLAAHVATTFAAMIRQTPALHAHWLEIQARLARVAAEQLARQAGTEAADPEPAIAGWALAGLVQVDMDARARHIRAGRRGARLRDAVVRGVRQAANLLETGLAPLNRGTAAAGGHGSADVSAGASVTRSYPRSRSRDAATSGTMSLVKASMPDSVPASAFSFPGARLIVNSSKCSASSR
jgi:hypothetical protein